MVRIRGLGHALSKVIGRALGREDNRDSDDAPGGESSQHPLVGNWKLPLLQRMLLKWMMQLKSYSNMLKKLLMMPKIFQASRVTHQC
ncbi:hypothetical protein GmHk_14G041544 [Glycine max]|nr:hypothetical protein GmHk_14G041544 [Glycine max]